MAFCCGLVGLRAAALQQRDRQPIPRFKGGILVVQVDAVVIDADRRPVVGLGKSDFRLFEDGKRQEIVHFSAHDIPFHGARSPWVGEHEPTDVVSNERAEMGRVIVIVLDDLQTLGGREDRVKLAARRVLDRLGPDDLVAMVYTSGRSDGARDFTRDRTSLQAAIDLFTARKTRFERSDSLQQPPGVTGVPPPRDRSRPGSRDNEEEPAEINLAKAFGQLDTLQTLTHIAGRLAPIPDRRKALIYVGEGTDASIAHPLPPDPYNFRFEDASVDEARKFVAAAQRANVAFYAIDPRGPTRFGEEGFVVESHPEELLLFSERARLSREGLKFLADETGGFAALNITDFAAAADQIVQENGSYYMLGYYPTDQKMNGAFRRVTVEVAHSGLRVQARKGYIARAVITEPAVASSRVQNMLRRAIARPLPSTDLTLRVWSGAFKGATRARASVAVVASAEYAIEERERPEAPLDDQLAFEVLVVDLEGKIRARDARVFKGTFARAADRTPAVQSAPTLARAQLVSRLEVSPGRYSLRVAVQSRRLGRVGSVFAELNVPDFRASPVSLSALVLGHETDDPRVQKRRTILDDLSLITPTAARRFERAGRLRAFVQVYGGAVSRPAGVELWAAMIAEGGQLVFGKNEHLDLTAVADAPAGVPFEVGIPLDSLEPGVYRVVIEARDAAGVVPLVQRSTVVTIGQPSTPRTHGPECLPGCAAALSVLQIHPFFQAHVIAHCAPRVANHGTNFFHIMPSRRSHLADGAGVRSVTSSLVAGDTADQFARP